MTLDPDELAGVVDLFGALTRAELDRALEEYAYRRDESVDEAAVEDALAAYALVAYEQEDGTERLAVGPTAFPTLPEGAEDLPHILEVGARAPDRERAALAAERRFRGDVARAVAAEDDAEIRRLLDVSYDLETWGDADLAELRAQLDDALDAG
jgi:hypothetical protein